MMRAENDARDPALLRKHSTIKSYTTSVATYPAIRVFHRPHSQIEKLPTKPTPLPLLVFIHGLGGSVAQFHPLLTSLVSSASCLAVDLPGCGESGFAPTDWPAYGHLALVELLSIVIDEHCNFAAGQEVVLIGHSMGCSLAASLASPSVPRYRPFRSSVAGIIAICPKVSDHDAEQVKLVRKLLNIPTPIFNLWRRWDQRGGTESASVKRFLGPNAALETKKLQIIFNQQSRSGVFRRIVYGGLPTIKPDGTTERALPGPEQWASLSVPVFAIAGRDDKVTTPDEIRVIQNIFSHDQRVGMSSPTSSSLEVPELTNSLNEDASSLKTSNAAPSQPDSDLPQETRTMTLDSGSIGSLSAASKPKRKRVLKTTILPSPATHALLYDPSTYRTLAGLIQRFLADHVDDRLSPGWQLNHLSTEGKWEVKNLVKWQTVQPVSEPIDDVFRAMKTLREVDDEHCPAVFVRTWRDRMAAVIDISHEHPVYNPATLDRGGIPYHKFATVSKVPPSRADVAGFVALVDHIRAAASPSDVRPIGVHCHYGFNRTGFFICAYLIERRGFSVPQAIAEFQAKRPPGIRHEHFIDTLWVRYCVGLKRAPTT